MSLQTHIVPVTAFQQNCTLLWDDPAQPATVCDPGGDVPAILAAIAERGLHVDTILLTHGHLDHAGGAADLRDALRQAQPGRTIRILGPDARDGFLLGGLAAQARQYGLPPMRDVTPDQWLAEGDRVTLAGRDFDILHCPGHTPGHIVAVAADRDFALMGDVLFRGAVGRTDFPYGDHAQLMDAINTKVMVLPDTLPFLCGHGPGSTIGYERRHNPFLRG